MASENEERAQASLPSVVAAIDAYVTHAAILDNRRGKVSLLPLTDSHTGVRWIDNKVRARNIAIAPLGSRLAALNSTGGELRVIDVATSANAQVMRIQHRATCVAFTAGGNTVTLGRHNAAPLVMRYEHPKRSDSFTGAREHTAALAYSRDGQLLASIDPQGIVHIWNTATRTVSSVVQTKTVLPRSITFSTDKTHIIVADGNGLITCWRIGDPDCAEIWTPQMATIAAIGTLDHQLVAVGTDADSRPLVEFLPYAATPSQPLQVAAALIHGAAPTPPSTRIIRTSVAGVAADLKRLFTNPSGLRTATRTAIVAERTAMVESLTTLDAKTKERITPAVVAAAQQIFDAQPYSTIIRRFFGDVPYQLLRLMQGALLFVLLLVVEPLVRPVTLRLVGLSKTLPQHDAAQFIPTLGGTFIGLWALGKLGRIPRMLRNLLQLAAMPALIQFRDRDFNVTDPPRLDTLIRRYTRLTPPRIWHVVPPHRIWLAVTLGVGASTVVTMFGWLYRWARSKGQRRRQAVQGALLHSLLDLAYWLQNIALTPTGRSSVAIRRRTMRLIADCADIAEGQWRTAMQTGSHDANKVVIRQSKAIAIAIRKWAPRAALGGADTPAICQAFSTAVANAADEDWRALGVDPSQVPRSRWQRAGFFALRGLALALPAAAAVIIPLTVHKITGQLAAVETILTYLPVAMLLRWLHVNEDVDAADKLSQLLLKPPTAAGDSKTS